MPQRHHRHHRHVDDHGVEVTVDVDDLDERGPLTLVETSSGMLADGERDAIARAVGVDDEAELSPEEAAMHIERSDLDAFD